jgi:hypothetical protein
VQHAYLKGKSTETALHDLFYKIDGSLAQKEFTSGVYFDVEGAFDNTSFESMDDEASDHGVCSSINRWIDFMLRSCSDFVDIGRVRVHMSKRRSCPQGVSTSLTEGCQLLQLHPFIIHPSIGSYN